MKHKHCPICGSDTWDYDVTNGEHTFCGSCHLDLMKIAKANHLVEFHNMAWTFPTAKSYFTALSLTTKF